MSSTPPLSGREHAGVPHFQYRLVDQVCCHFLMADNAVDADAHRVPKTRTQHFVYAQRDTEDGPLEIIPPEESSCVVLPASFCPFAGPAQRQRSNGGGGCLAVAVADWRQRGGQRGSSTAVATAFLQLGSGGGSAVAAAAVAAVRWWW